MAANTEIDLNTVTVDHALVRLIEDRGEDRTGIEFLNELEDMIRAHRGGHKEIVLICAESIVELLETVLADPEFPETYAEAKWPAEFLYVPEEAA